MAASTRIKATNISFMIDDVEYSCDANMIEMTLNDAPGDVQTFCETSVGKEWKLQLDGITSGDSTSLYRLLWNNHDTEVPFTLAPQGGAAGPDAPQYTGIVVFDELPPFSLTANEVTKFTVQLTIKNNIHDPASNIYWGVTVVTA